MNFSDIPKDALITKLFVFIDDKENKHFIAGFGHVANDQTTNDDMTQLAHFIALMVGWKVSDEMLPVDMQELERENKTFLPHFRGTIKSMFGNLETGMFAGPEFDEMMQDRKNKLN